MDQNQPDSLDLKAFFMAMSDAEREAFATDAGTTVGYLRTHVVYRRKTPRRQLIESIALACQRRDASITRERVFRFFYEGAAA